MSDESNVYTVNNLTREQISKDGKGPSTLLKLMTLEYPNLGFGL